MIRSALALFYAEILLGIRAGSGFGTGVLFFACFVTIIPFAVGPDLVLLGKLGAAFLWIGALLSCILGLDRLFKTDADDGSLDVVRHVSMPLEICVLAKILAYWATSCLPLVLAAPLLGLMLSMNATHIAVTTGALLIGTPAFAFFGALGAALTVRLRRGGLLLPIIILPLCVPIVIFGVAIAENANTGTAFTALLLLLALVLSLMALVPFAVAALLRWDEH